MSAADQPDQQIDQVAERDAPVLPARATLPDRYPPEDYRSLAGEYPWLTVAAGLGAGLLVGAMLPRGLGGKFGKRAAHQAGSLSCSPTRLVPRQTVCSARGCSAAVLGGGQSAAPSA